ncbi:hypothetical protein CRE_09378 [Caenorhabditis remanei]|uniref:Homeobox domain-containing protein n=1 Tax=Caenorhabditis remanei TaxID=31234 RepID=E3LII3_CAERE|nr:hypothetical protein CRE_09378 [Caenorhabditis remanei]
MSSRILENEPASPIKKLKSGSNMSAYSSNYVETSESSDSESEEDSDADSSYEEPQPKKKKLVRMMKTLKNHQEVQEEGSGNKDGNSQEVKKMPMKRKIAEVLLTKNKTVTNWFLKTRREAENPEKWKELNEKRRISDRERRRRKKAEINKFFNYHRNKEQTQGKYVKVNKEISKKLEEEFEINPNPTTERKKEIAEANKLKLQAVSHWFKTKRDRLKNPEKWEEINKKKRIMGREQRMKMKAQNQVRMMLTARSSSVFYSKFRLQALGYFRMRRLMDRKRGKKVPEEKDVPKFKGVWIRRQKEQVINQEEASDESDESDDNSDDSDDSEDMDMHNSGSENFDSDESFTNSDEWDSDDDDKVDEFVKREPKEESALFPKFHFLIFSPSFSICSRLHLASDHYNSILWFIQVFHFFLFASFYF